MKGISVLGCTYSVVAFIVTVQLVEKRVKSRVGTVIVASRSVQYKMEDVRCKIAMTSQAIKPSQLEEPCVATTS